MRGKRGAATPLRMSEAIRAAFVRQAGWCRTFGAPFTGAVCAAIAARLDPGTVVGARVLDWPGDPFADALPMRVTGGLNGLVRAGALPGLAAVYPPHAPTDDAELADRVATALADDRLLPWLDSAPQTNEVMRASVLMSGLLTIAAAHPLPLRLFELGASAGLNLRMAGYAYRLGEVAFGPADAPVTLAPTWTGPPPPTAGVRVVSRRGVDLAPIDLGEAAARARLLAYIWPDQPARVARAEAAIAAFAADPVTLDRGDAAAWVAANVEPQPVTVTVVYHSIAWVYFPPATQAAITAHLELQAADATAVAPLAWLRYEEDIPGAGVPPTLRLRLWPGDDQLLARAHPHGSSVEWLA